jgi:hypothetical protein
VYELGQCCLAALDGLVPQVIAAARITLQQGARIVHETSAKGD